MPSWLIARDGQTGPNRNLSFQNLALYSPVIRRGILRYSKQALEVVPVRLISSTIEGSTGKFTELQGELQGLGYTLGGNWDYEQGCFDKPMDSAHKVWLRIPFQVTDGNIDSEYSENNAIITLGQPFVLKHLYNEGNDPEASVRVVGAMFDQFQSPVDPDAEVEDRWAERGEELVRMVEAVLTR